MYQQVTKFHALYVASRASDGVNAGGIQYVLGVGKTRADELLRQLYKEGFLYRHRNAMYERGKLIGELEYFTLTRKGHEKVDLFGIRSREHLDSVQAHLHQDARGKHMGLDITAYSNLKALNRKPTDDDYDEKVVIYSDDHFKARLDGMPDGTYETTNDTKETRFRAGSYSGYSHWRSMLAKLALDTTPEYIWEHLSDFEGKPFIELINFSDCEGAIGPKTAKKLAADFAAFEERAEALYKDHEDGNYFLSKYKEWKKAFELAAQNGFVRFH